jgi:exonuclease III
MPKAATCVRFRQSDRDFRLLPVRLSGPERQEAKFRFMDLFLPHLQTLHAEGREVVICGDWNIAHKEST